MLNKKKLNANAVGAAAHSDPQTNKTTKFDCRGGRLCPPANKQNGITLIALIITIIIVMLILVGVTINVALNGGLFGKAQTATRETEIKIGTSVVPPENEEFEKYIMGADKTGRPLIGETGIMNQSTLAFIDDPLTADVDETETLGVEFLTGGQNEDATKVFIYAKYDNKAYKITCDETFKSKKLEIIYEPKGTEGQKTAEGWTILYDNGTTAEAVSPEALGSLRLGYSETAATNETQLTETIESYNNAIKEINDYCKNELTGLPTNSGVRSVGASSETTTAKYSSDNLATWNSAYNGVGLIGDTNFEQDLVRMAYWGESSIGTSYWMASRVVDENSDYVGFGVYYVYEDGILNRSSLWIVISSGIAYDNYPSYAVRPIITIENL